MMGVSFGISDFRGNSLTTNETSLALNISGGYRWPLNEQLLRACGGAGR
jgi:hypothetical protein